VCAVRIATACGINDVIDTAREAGIASPLDPYPSLALGACAVTPLEMATAYGTLARGGAYMPAQLIRSIKTEDGTAYTLTASASTNLPAENVKQLVDLMQDVVNYGTGAQAHLAGIPAAGKTGTADQGRDIWFVGFTPDTVTAVWGGSDKNLPVRGNSVTGGAVMAHMWHDYMTSFYAQRRPARGLAFAQPSQALLKTMPKYDDVTLLTADASQQIPQPATGTSAHGAIVDARQASANIPTVIQNARNAITGGIGSAFFVQGLTAAQRWQTAASKIALSQPSEQTGTATNPALQPQPVSAQASDSTSVQQGQAAQQGTTVQLTDNTANAKQATEPVSAPADSPPLDAAAQLRKYQVASQRATGSM
jgi:membrane peptidoglycan carboxypeptidase